MVDTQEDTRDDNHQRINKTFTPINVSDRQAAPSFIQPKISRSKLKRVVLSFGFILFIVMAGILTTNLFKEEGNSSASNQIKSVFSSEEMADYSPPEDDFTILMPGVPAVSESKSKHNSIDIPVTTYERLIENASKNYTLTIYDYKDAELGDELKFLEDTLKTALQEIPDAKLVSSKAGAYASFNSLDATYMVISGELMTETHLRYIIKDTKLYAIILIGGDQTKFDEFASSLRFNKEGDGNANN